ncbi:MAG: L-threonylcarbamoyladenylate synthase [Anaerolineae bacterium]|nr:L-threonylcarbamoyladenylate synthase [Anaerolineae bacterium]
MEIVHAGSDYALQRAIEVLEAGGLVAFPTDTVYGLAAKPWDVAAVARIYEAKCRPAERAIPLLLSDAGQLERVAVVTPQMRQQLDLLIDRFWPGGLTLVLPKSEVVPEIVSQGPTVAVRVPDLPLALALIKGVHGVLAVTSANISGQPSPVTAQEVEEQLAGRIDLIIDGGPVRGGVPSTILDCTVSPPALLRRGAIPEEALSAVIGPLRAPGE